MTLAGALPLLGRKAPGLRRPRRRAHGGGEPQLLPGAHFPGRGRTSPPVRGLYPCGEGAGYAGGILSAAADGMRAPSRSACRSGPAKRGTFSWSGRNLRLSGVSDGAPMRPANRPGHRPPETGFAVNLFHAPEQFEEAMGRGPGTARSSFAHSPELLRAAPADAAVVLLRLCRGGPLLPGRRHFSAIPAACLTNSAGCLRRRHRGASG
jgi:hypothetical protein